MPTTTIAGSVTLTNLGPLTTTFTAPSSCSTDFAISGINVAYSSPQVTLAYIVGTCEKRAWTEDDAACMPHGEKLGEIEQTAITERTVAYYSPGLYCPENYQTVGVAVNNGSSYAEVSGMFAPPFTVVSYDYSATTHGYSTYTTDFPEMNFEGNQFTSALGPGETLVACCPNGYTADAYAAGCYSSFDATELASSTGCYNVYTGSWLDVVSAEAATWEYQGRETTEKADPFPIPTDFLDFVAEVTYTYDESGRPTPDEYDWPSEDSSGTWPSYSVSWQSYSASWHSGSLPSLALRSADPDATSAYGDLEDLSSAIADATSASYDWPEETYTYEEPEPEGLAAVGIIWLVHNASDLEVVSTTEEGGAEETGGDDEGAAASVPANMWTLVGAMAAVWGIGTVAGAGLLV